MKIANWLMDFIKHIPVRTIKSYHTTLGGTAYGVVGMALVAKLEEMTGCHFAEAFAGIDWMQLFVFGFSQLAGALTTDSNIAMKGDTVINAKTMGGTVAS